MQSLISLFVFTSVLQSIRAGPIHLQKRAVFYIANETACVVDNEVYSNGDPIPTEDACEMCRCRPPGFACVMKQCQTKPGCRAVRTVGECCPQYQCGCIHKGRMYGDNEEIQDQDNPCYKCTCQAGSIACAHIDCYYRTDCLEKWDQPHQCCPHYRNCTERDDNDIANAAEADSIAERNKEFFSNDPEPHEVQPDIIDEEVVTDAEDSLSPGVIITTDVGVSDSETKYDTNEAEISQPQEKPESLVLTDPEVVLIEDKYPLLQNQEGYKIVPTLLNIDSVDVETDQAESKFVATADTVLKTGSVDVMADLEEYIFVPTADTILSTGSVDDLADQEEAKFVSTADTILNTDSVIVVANQEAQSKPIVDTIFNIGSVDVVANQEAQSNPTVDTIIDTDGVVVVANQEAQSNPTVDTIFNTDSVVVEADQNEKKIVPTSDTILNNGNIIEVLSEIDDRLPAEAVSNENVVTGIPEQNDTDIAHNTIEKRFRSLENDTSNVDPTTEATQSTQTQNVTPTTVLNLIKGKFTSTVSAENKETTTLGTTIKSLIEDSIEKVEIKFDDLLVKEIETNAANLFGVFLNNGKPEKVSASIVVYEDEDETTMPEPSLNNSSTFFFKVNTNHPEVPTSHASSVDDASSTIRSDVIKVEEDNKEVNNSSPQTTAADQTTTELYSISTVNDNNNTATSL